MPLFGRAGRCEQGHAGHGEFWVFEEVHLELLGRVGVLRYIVPVGLLLCTTSTESLGWKWTFVARTSNILSTFEEAGSHYIAKCSPYVGVR